jgi:hypothetical protein
MKVFDDDTGDIREAFASYRRMLAGALDDAVKIKIIEDCAYQSAKTWSHGLQRPDAVDEISDMAVCNGLGDTLAMMRSSPSSARPCSAVKLIAEPA